MDLILVGGAPGVGKSTVAEEILGLAIGGDRRLQWVDVDTLWRHQPWRVDERTTAMVRANLRSVLRHAADAGMDTVLVTWVFQDSGLHELVQSLAPAGTPTTTVQLVASPEAWSGRLAVRSIAAEHEPFYRGRYAQAQSTPADHVVDTDGLTPAEVAACVADLTLRPSHPDSW